MTNAELIKALRNHRTCETEECETCELMNAAADALEAADKRIAELMPKEGEWIEDEYGYIHCSKCGMEWDEPEHSKTNYCPNCGARMRQCGSD